MVDFTWFYEYGAVRLAMYLRDLEQRPRVPVDHEVVRGGAVPQEPGRGRAGGVEVERGEEGERPAAEHVPGDGGPAT